MKNKLKVSSFVFLNAPCSSVPIASIVLIAWISVVTPSGGFTLSSKYACSLFQSSCEVIAAHRDFTFSVVMFVLVSAFLPSQLLRLLLESQPLRFPSPFPLELRLALLLAWISPFESQSEL